MKVAGITKLLILAAAAMLGACQKAGDGVGLDSAGKVLPFCQAHPEDPGCVVVDPCVANPAGPGCHIDTCLANPAAPGCHTDTCLVNPSAPGCRTKVKFAEVYPLFEANYCMQCHLVGGSGYLGGGLLLSADSAYGDLVNAPVINQTTAKDWVRVKPGYPDSSILYLKLSMSIPKLPSGKQYGSLMPMGRKMLDTASLNLIKRWILDGAEK